MKVQASSKRKLNSSASEGSIQGDIGNDMSINKALDVLRKLTEDQRFRKIFLVAFLPAKAGLRLVGVVVVVVLVLVLVGVTEIEKQA